MGGDLLSVFHRSSIGKVSRDPGGSESVATDGAGNFGLLGSSLDHSQSIIAVIG